MVHQKQQNQDELTMTAIRKTPDEEMVDIIGDLRCATDMLYDIRQELTDQTLINELLAVVHKIDADHENKA
jgi:hypothetical protein